MSDSRDPPWPVGSPVHGILQDKNTGVVCHFLLQGIVPTQGLGKCKEQVWGSVRTVTLRKQKAASPGRGEGWLLSGNRKPPALDAGKLKPPCTTGGNAKWNNCCRKMQFLRKLKPEIPHDQQPTSEGKPKGTESSILNRSLNTPVHNIMIHKVEKQPRCSLTDERINIMLHVHTMEYHSVFKRKEILQYEWALKTLW